MKRGGYSSSTVQPHSQKGLNLLNKGIFTHENSLIIDTDNYTVPRKSYFLIIHTVTLIVFTLILINGKLNNVNYVAKAPAEVV